MLKADARILDRFGKPVNFFRDLSQSRYLIYQLAKRDFKTRYIGSGLGLFWAFLQPLAMMAILWFVFEHGLKSSPYSSDIPFVAWFFTAMVAWNYFSDVFSVSTGVLNEYSFMLKKVEFNVSTLPIVKVVSSAGIHLIFLGILFIILAINGMAPSWHWFQIVYYFFAMTYLLVGLSWLTSSLNIFLKDTAQIVSILSQFGFWLTPIVWDVNQLPENMRVYLRLNPMLYIIDGYRNSLLHKKSIFEEDLSFTLYFWVFSTLVMLVGIVVFRRLRPHFADVL